MEGCTRFAGDGVTMRKINKKTGEIFTIKPGGMYAPFPIPAYQVLIRKREILASRVFTCLISHLGSNGWAVFPKYDTICYEAGVGRNSIKKSLDVLEELGFIKIGWWLEGKHKRNIYFIQEACYNSSLMNKFARSYQDAEGVCRRCTTTMDRGSFKLSANGGLVHMGCGGSVKVIGQSSKTPYRYADLKSHAKVKELTTGCEVLNLTPVSVEN
jgi:hypothetical protein